jgi:hypothetical protein
MMGAESRTITRGTTAGHHWYKLDGMMMPSPSKIKLTPPFLDNYHAECAADVLSDHWAALAGRTESERRKYFLEKTRVNMEAAAVAGKLRHSLMESLLKGEPARTADEAAIADAEAAARVFDQYQIRPVASEQAVVDAEVTWCSGTTDVIADVPGYGLVILDFKFGKEVWPDHALQLSAYAHMTNMIIEVENRGPRGGKLASTWALGEMPAVRRDVALLVHTTQGVPRLVEVKTDGWVWAAVVAWCRAWWFADPRMRKSGPGFNSPISDPVPALAIDDAPPY